MSVFERLKGGVLSSQSELYNDVILAESRWNQTQTASGRGTIDFGEKQRSFSNVDQALLWLIDRIETEDLGSRYQQKFAEHRAVPDTHRYTCDRVDQSDDFQLARYDPPASVLAHAGKLFFFYLYGDVRQGHEALFHRLRLQEAGLLENWEQANYDPGIKTCFVDIKPRVSRNPKLFQLNILKSLMSRFFEPLHGQQPLAQKKLSDLLDSEKLRDFGPNDLVFIRIALDEHNWEAKTTPGIIRTLYEGFCQGRLPATAPSFFFFFGIEYQKENKQIRAEVEAAIKEAVYGLPLPELGPVSLADITEWFSRYRVLLAPGETPADAAQRVVKQHMGTDPTFDMIDLLPLFQQLIDQHNSGLIP
jgi:hypothetical protein